jgi:hypothetical protein
MMLAGVKAVATAMASASSSWHSGPRNSVLLGAALRNGSLTDGRDILVRPGDVLDDGGSAR